MVSPAMLIVALVIAIAIILFCIIVLKLNASIGMVLASLFMGVAGGLDLMTTMDTISSGFGSMMTSIGLPVGFGTILARRAINKEVHDRIYEITSRFEAHFHAVGEDVRQGNPSPGNKAGGITTLEEKSLGCIHKGGHSPINAVYDYAKQVESKQGLVIMDTPGNDPASVAAMVAGGAQVIVFSSGRGSPVGHPIAPVVKVTGNKITFANMEDNIDFCAAPLIYGEKTVEQLGTDLLNMVVETACGKQTKAEALGFVETAIARICNYV